MSCQFSTGGVRRMCLVLARLILCMSVLYRPLMAQDKPTEPESPVDANALKAMIENKNAVRVGRAKAQPCTRCHGRDGIHTLAVRAGWQGSDGEFAIVKLKQFRDGAVAHEVMTAVASVLRDEDIVQIGRWLDSIAARR